MVDVEKPSKTKRKREMHELQALGEALVDLPPPRLASVALPDDLRDAVLEAQRLTKHEAKRRQLQYIGRLMREIDPAPIRERLAEWNGQSAEATRALHALERWRNRLIDDDDALTSFAKSYPHANLQELRASIREARKEATVANGERAGRHYRELFRLLRAAMTQVER